MTELTFKAVTAAAAKARRLHEFVIYLSGWKRALAAFVAGILSVLAFAPFHLSPVLFLTLPIVLWLTLDQPAMMATESEASSAGIDGENLPENPLRQHAPPLTHSVARHSVVRRAAIMGWWFGFGFHLAGLSWIGSAFLVEADRFAWLMPFAVMIMPAGLALFYALGMAIVCGFVVMLPARLATSPIVRILIFALAFSAIEWLRGTVLTGFPWNALGYAATYPLVLMQAAGVVGIYGLSLWVAIVATSPLVLIACSNENKERHIDRHHYRDRCQNIGPAFNRGIAFIGLVVAPLILAFGYGALVLRAPMKPHVDGVMIRIVQPSIPQIDKFDLTKRFSIFQEHISLILGEALTVGGGRADGAAIQRDGDLVASDGVSSITHVIWPEAAMPFLSLRSPEALKRIAAALPKSVTLIAGTLRLEGPISNQSPTKSKVFNSAIAISHTGKHLATYDKIHLVPFGEYLPFQTTLEWFGLESLTRQRGGFTPGVLPRRAMIVPGLPPISVLICYEVVFPDEVHVKGGRPGLLLNLTNDAWFGATTGPYQHFHQARVRAVETGLPMLRVANNGISGTIDGRGRVLASLPLNARNVIDTPLPSTLDPTIYALFGDALFWLNWLAIAALLGGLLAWQWRFLPRAA